MTTLKKLLLIVNEGEASKALHIAKEDGVLGGTILLALGTSRNTWLKFLGLDDIRKELLIMLAPKDVAVKAAESLTSKLRLERPNRGILAVQNVLQCYGSHGLHPTEEIGGIDMFKYLMITVITDRGQSDDVMAVATKAGAAGGTLLHGRGSGVHDTSTLFSFPVEPEKDVILLIVRRGTEEPIIQAIEDYLDLEEPGNGILFVQPVEKVYGLSDPIVPITGEAPEQEE